jgi:isoquinoline 1-oxidoreductase beta subunit
MADTAPGAGRFRGIDVWDTYDTFVSQVAEISVDRKSGALRVHRVVCAVDCGQYANPAGIEAQIEGGIATSTTTKYQ